MNSSWVFTHRRPLPKSTNPMDVYPWEDSTKLWMPHGCHLLEIFINQLTLKLSNVNQSKSRETQLRTWFRETWHVHTMCELSFSWSRETQHEHTMCELSLSWSREIQVSLGVNQLIFLRFTSQWIFHCTYMLQSEKLRRIGVCLVK